VTQPAEPYASAGPKDDHGKNGQQPGAVLGGWVEEGEGSSHPTFTPKDEICAQIFFIVWKCTKLSKCSGIAWCTKSSETTDPFKAVTGLT